MKDESVKTRLNEYFARKSAVKSNFIIAVLLYLVDFVFVCLGSAPAVINIMDMFMPISLCLAAYCYFRHNVNGMQCALGAFLGGQIMDNIYAVTFFHGAAVLPLVFSVAVFIAHQALISQRRSKDGILYSSQLLGALFMLACVGNCVVNLISHGFGFDTLNAVTFDIFTAAAMNMIITIETRINEYKIRRDALTSGGKWNDGAKEDLKREIFG